MGPYSLIRVLRFTVVSPTSSIEADLAYSLPIFPHFIVNLNPKVFARIDIQNPISFYFRFSKVFSVPTVILDFFNFETFPNPFLPLLAGRRLIGADPKDSPAPTSDRKPMDESGQKKTDSPPTSTGQKGDPASSNNATSPVPPPVPKTVNEKEPNNSTPAIPPPVAKSNDEKSHDEEKKKEDQTFSQSSTNENCDDLKKCSDNGKIVACISKSGNSFNLALRHFIGELFNAFFHYRVVK
ncbi:spore wall protein 2 isoform X2 [Senna tora]|uniref:Spore wall protein 2 isoform X2 n=1 Tax=Senna tora TaxID=362788 RepID=A0A834XJ69_9FABA|nr:spore wall protein 2 isoform X2 [Senna tora]